MQTMCRKRQDDCSLMATCALSFQLLFQYPNALSAHQTARRGVLIDKGAANATRCACPHLTFDHFPQSRYEFLREGL